jgi:WD40 repeat protein
MQPLPLAARVFEVIADLGEDRSPRYRLGSGCLIAGRTVLTAAHVVTGAMSVQVRGPDKCKYQAVVALIEITGGTFDVPAMGLAAVTRDRPAGDPVERCHVLGYPKFMERDSADGRGRFRETADALGQVLVLSQLVGGLLSVEVSSSPEPLPAAQVVLGDSPWAGISGGPLVTDGFLLGVVTEHALRAGPSAITAVPLTALERDPKHPHWGPGVDNPGAWWSRMGVSGTQGLRLLPAASRRRGSAYLAIVREIRHRTGVLTGRQDDLAAIASFATGVEGYRRQVGEPWAGKTSLLAEAVLTLPANVDIVCYFLSRLAADADSAGFMAAVVPQLASLLDAELTGADLHQFRALWQHATERADAEQRHLLLVVDGLDEDLRPRGLPSVAALLPATMSSHGHVLVSSRSHLELPADIPVGHPLRKARPVPVGPFAGANERAILAQQEIDDLLRRDDDGLAADVLGLLTAAAGPLTVQDLADMTTVAPQSAELSRRIRSLVTTSAARSLQAVGPPGNESYQFAHESLLSYAQANHDLSHPDFRRRLHSWAERWRTVGWLTPGGEQADTPRYLLDVYPATLDQDPGRLAELTTDVSWIQAAIETRETDKVLADLRRSAAANPANTTVAAGLAAVVGQARNLRPPRPINEPGYILRQLWMQSAELGEETLADNIRSRLREQPGVYLTPQWTTRRANRGFSAELGRHRDQGGRVGDQGVRVVAVLPDGRVVTGSVGGDVFLWDPAQPHLGPAELGRHNDTIRAIGVLPNGQVITSGDDDRLLVWNPAQPQTGPAELGRHSGMRVIGIWALGVLPDGRVVTGSVGGDVFLWDPGHLESPPTELGHCHSGVMAIGVLPDGRVVSGGKRGLLIWDPNRPEAGPAELGSPGRFHGTVQAIGILADGRVVTSGDYGTLQVWDPARPGAGLVDLSGYAGRAHAIGTLADGRVVTAKDLDVLIWDPDHPELGPAELGHHDRVVNAIAVLADGRVVAGDWGGQVLLWNPPEPSATTAQRSPHAGWVLGTAVMADGRIVTGDSDGRVLIRDPAVSGARAIELGRHRGNVDAVAVLADGRVVTTGGGSLMVWNPGNPGIGLSLGTYGQEIRAVAVLADGRVVTAGEDGRVLIWDPANPRGGRVQLGRRVLPLWAVAVLADGRIVTSGPNLLIWDPAHPSAGPANLGHHEGTVGPIAVLSDGRVAAGGNDGRVMIWDPARPHARPTEVGRHDGSVQAIAVLPGGRIATGGYSDGRLDVYETTGDHAKLSELRCSVNVLATARSGPARNNLVIAHQGNGISLWSIKGHPS